LERRFFVNKDWLVDFILLLFLSAKLVSFKSKRETIVGACQIFYQCFFCLEHEQRLI